VNSRSSLGIGLAGFGTVGSGVWNTLMRNGDLITGRTGGGVRLHIAKILVRDPAKARSISGEVSAGTFTTDRRDLVEDPSVEIVVELIGGTTDAFEIVAAALRAGKPVVTGNKALLAERGVESSRSRRKPARRSTSRPPWRVAFRSSAPFRTRSSATASSRSPASSTAPRITSSAA
jgi:homoserine dehydrogenase